MYGIATNAGFPLEKECLASVLRSVGVTSQRIGFWFDGRPAEAGLTFLAERLEDQAFETYYADTGARNLDDVIEADKRYLDDNRGSYSCDGLFAIIAALKVVVLNPQIRAYLEVADPKALEQARRALGLLNG